MGFDSKKFLKEKFTDRTFPVPVPDLKDYFPEGAEAVWVVRGLTGQEVGRSAEAADRNKNITAILAGLTSDTSKEKSDALRNLLGVGANTPSDIAKRIEQLVAGSVDPKCTSDLAVRLCEVFPVEFYQLTNKIIELTGQGQVPGKRKTSGEIVASGPASPCATPEGNSCTRQDPTSSPADT